MSPVLMDHLRVARRGPGRPRSRPARIRGDKAYSSRAIRTHVRERGFNENKQWRGLATRYDKLALTYRAAPSYEPPLSGSNG